MKIKLRDCVIYACLLVCGMCVARVLTWSVEDDLRAERDAGTLEVLVAAVDIAPGEKIDPSMLRAQKLAAPKVPRYACFKADGENIAENAVVKEGIKAGEMLSYLQLNEAPQVSLAEESQEKMEDKTFFQIPIERELALFVKPSETCFDILIHAPEGMVLAGGESSQVSLMRKLVVSKLGDVIEGEVIQQQLLLQVTPEQKRLLDLASEEGKLTAQIARLGSSESVDYLAEMLKHPFFDSETLQTVLGMVPEKLTLEEVPSVAVKPSPPIGQKVSVVEGVHWTIGGASVEEQEIPADPEAHQEKETEVDDDYPAAGPNILLFESHLLSPRHFTMVVLTFDASQGKGEQNRWKFRDISSLPSE